jgi:hypothetical protein
VDKVARISERKIEGVEIEIEIVIEIEVEAIKGRYASK